MSPQLGVVGAGAGGAAATYVIDDACPDAEITVFEKSRGVCGRAAARRRDGLVYEYGANYLLDADERVSALVTGPFAEGLVEIEAPIWTVDADGTVREGPAGNRRRWTYADGITRLAKHLLGATDATVRRETRIVDVRHEGNWRLADADGTLHGPFDALLLNPPAPQTADLLIGTGIDAVDRLGEAAAAVGYQACWTAVLGYDVRVEAPYYGLRTVDDRHAVGWIGREECKPGHVPDGASVLIVQPPPSWSADRYDAAPEANIAALAEHAASIVGDRRLATPSWTDHQGWRYAFPTDSVEESAVQTAAADDVYVTGDWVAGDGRLHAAVREGLTTGDTVAAALSNQ